MEHINEGFDQIRKVISYFKSHMEEVKKIIAKKKSEFLSVKSLSDLKRKIEEWCADIDVDPVPFLQLASNEKLQMKFSSDMMREGKGLSHLVNWGLIAACFYVYMHLVISTGNVVDARGFVHMNPFTPLMGGAGVLLFGRIGMMISIFINAHHDVKNERISKKGSLGYVHKSEPTEEELRETVKEAIKTLLAESINRPDSDNSFWVPSDISYLEGKDFAYDDDDDSYSKPFYRHAFLVMVQKPSKDKYLVKTLRYKGDEFLDVSFNDFAEDQDGMKWLLSKAIASIADHKLYQ